MRSRLVHAAGPLLVFAWTLFRLLTAEPPEGTLEPPPAAEESPVAVVVPDRHYADDARRLLRGLDIGDDLGGWTVVGARGPAERVLIVDVQRDGIRITLMVVRDGEQAEPAMLRTERFNLYYSLYSPPEAILEFSDVALALDGLYFRIDGDAPIPEGM